MIACFSPGALQNSNILIPDLRTLFSSVAPLQNVKPGSSQLLSVDFCMHFFLSLRGWCFWYSGVLIWFFGVWIWHLGETWYLGQCLWIWDGVFKSIKQTNKGSTNHLYARRLGQAHTFLVVIYFWRSSLRSSHCLSTEGREDGKPEGSRAGPQGPQLEVGAQSRPKTSSSLVV